LTLAGLKGLKGMIGTDLIGEIMSRRIAHDPRRH
jgi:hypothetical protein